MLVQTLAKGGRGHAAGEPALTGRIARTLALLALGLVATLITAVATLAASAAPDPFAPILHALDYLAVDYPGAVKDGKVLDQGEYAEQVEFATSVKGMIAALPARPERAALEATAGGLASAVRDKRP
ncbi:MAG TPA: hypothetical protein VJX92_28765, partial [Methylomirabilota bacterium]|nr:hypothetical protein [Methylomirabilota bacterium]